MALRALGDDEEVNQIDTPGGPQRNSVITEAGIYKLIPVSRRAEAREFDHWVRHIAHLLDADERGLHLMHTLDGP